MKLVLDLSIAFLRSFFFQYLFFSLSLWFIYRDGFCVVVRLWYSCGINRKKNNKWNEIILNKIKNKNNMEWIKQRLSESKKHTLWDLELALNRTQSTHFQRAEMKFGLPEIFSNAEVDAIFKIFNFPENWKIVSEILTITRRWSALNCTWIMFVVCW